MTPHRLYAKLFTEAGPPVSLPAFIPVFHRWIERQDVDELLLDVHDYGHVPDGPGILLVAHEADYAFDLSGGRPGP